MRQALGIIGVQMRMVFKSKALLAMMFVMPLFFSFIFGMVLSGGGASNAMPLALVDEDHTVLSAKLAEQVKADKGFWVTETTRDALNQLFSDKKAAVAVVIPAGFEQSAAGNGAPELQLVQGSGNIDAEVAPTISRYATLVVGDYRLARQVAGANATEDAIAEAYTKVHNDRQSAGVTVESQEVQQKKQQQGFSMNDAALGFAVVFVMMTVFMQGGTILQERQRGTWGRLLTTPVARLWVLVGYISSAFLTGLVQFAVLVIASRVLFKTNWGPWLPLMAMAAVFILCSAGLGLFLAGIVKTAEQQRSIGMILVISTSMLGGAYWPLELMSPTMQRIGYLTPQAWAMEGFREVMLRGGAWSGLTWPMIVLGGLTLVFMTAGLFRVRFE